jgi:cytoskeletal protein RodZ
MGEFGARLKTAREQRGVSLRQIAGATRISMTALEALERDDFSRLPGGIFSRAFVRAYAVEVGLDPEATVAEFLVEFGRHEREAAIETARPEVTEEDRAFLERQQQATRIFRIVAIVFVLAVIAIGLWQGQRLLHEFSPRETVAPPKGGSRVPEPPPAPTISASEQVTAPPTGSLSIEFSVTAECSVQVSADGQDVFFRFMRPGDLRKSVSAQRQLQVQVDNAGAFEWAINGRPAKALGAINERRNVTITPATIARFLQ